jgi:hypothetical protein
LTLLAGDVRVVEGPFQVFLVRSVPEINLRVIAVLRNGESDRLTAISALGEAHASDKVGIAHLELGANVDVVDSEVGSIGMLSESGWGASDDPGAVRAGSSAILQLKLEGLLANPVHADHLVRNAEHVQVVVTVTFHEGKNALGAPVVLLPPVLNVENLKVFSLNLVENPMAHIVIPAAEACVIIVAVGWSLKPCAFGSVNPANGHSEDFLAGTGLGKGCHCLLSGQRRFVKCKSSDSGKAGSESAEHCIN